MWIRFRDRFRVPQFLVNDNPSKMDNFEVQKEHGDAQPQEIANPEDYVNKYRQATENAKQGGFDGIELYAANGYLPNQFLDNTSNQGQDQWGRSIENRCRFTLRIIDEISAVYGHDRVI
jgi:2,4-dienoyl-CoA reductase-like NADH-dependent reductase (Old Yellow Enzyme family)